MDKNFIPVNTPLMSGKEEEYIVNCIQTGWISSEGPYIKQFEEGLASYVRRKQGIAVSNGSAALDIAVKALDIGVGDEVIVPSFTIISPVQSIVTAGATPVLVESDIETWNMDISQVESKITAKTKAILIVHIYGLPVDMDPIIALCEKYQLFLIEDAAEMHGQTYKGKACGSFGNISTFSFYPNKLITTGEGGMIMVDDADLAQRCRNLRNLAFEPNKRRFVHEEIGWNYRMTNLQAALGLAQYENIDKHLLRKREIGNRYQKNLEGLAEKGFQLPLKTTTYADNIYWIFGLVAETEMVASQTVQKLTEAGIGTRPFFWCMHEQPVFKKMELFKNANYPIAEKMARNGFYLPSGLGISDEEIDIVSDKLHKILK